MTSTLDLPGARALRDDAPASALALSYSRSSLFMRCPAAYDFRYRQGVATPPSLAMLIGSAVDAAFDVNYTQKAATGRDVPLDEFVGAALTYFDGATRDPAELEAGVSQLEIADAREMVAACADVARRKVCPVVQPRASQLHLRASIVAQGWFRRADGSSTQIPDANSGVEVHGYLDALAADGSVVDNKVISPSGLGNRKRELARDAQLSTYGLLLALHGYDLPPTYRLDCVVKGRQPYYVPLETTRSAADLRAVHALYLGLAESILAGAKHANPTGWWCSEKWCGFWSRCAQGGGGAARGDEVARIGEVEF